MGIVQGLPDHGIHKMNTFKWRGPFLNTLESMTQVDQSTRRSARSEPRPSIGTPQAFGARGGG
jgi:hypothetical protein